MAKEKNENDNQVDEVDDIVEDIGEMIEYQVGLKGGIVTPADAGDLAAAVKNTVRERFKGERAYIKQSKMPSAEQLAIAEKFNGANLAEIMREFGVSRATVYRYAKRYKRKISANGSN